MASEQEDTLVIATKSSFIYQRLKQNILDGRLKPGEKLAASKLAHSFGVSVIPLREAFNLLIAEGLLTNIPHRGTYVTEIEVSRLKEIFPIAAVLEGYAAREAAVLLRQKDFHSLSKLLQQMEQARTNHEYARMSDLHREFHMTIYRASANQHLLKLIDDLWQRSARPRVFGLVPVRAFQSIQEHAQILEALKRRDKSEAERLIIQQKNKASRAIIRTLEKNEDTHQGRRDGPSPTP